MHHDVSREQDVARQHVILVPQASIRFDAKHLLFIIEKPNRQWLAAGCSEKAFKSLAGNRPIMCLRVCSRTSHSTGWWNVKGARKPVF
jgi:hypothetical protein